MQIYVSVTEPEHLLSNIAKYSVFKPYLYVWTN